MYAMSFSSASLFPSVSARAFYHRMIRNCFDLENGDFAGEIATDVINSNSPIIIGEFIGGSGRLCFEDNN